MIILEPVTSESFRGAESIKVLRYQLANVPISSTSDIFRLDDIISDGKIQTVRVVCESTDYDISIRTKQIVTLPSLDEVLKVININKQYDENSLDIIFSNNDNPEISSLYIVIINNDSSNPTSTVDLEVIINRM